MRLESSLYGMRNVALDHLCETDETVFPVSYLNPYLEEKRLAGNQRERGRRGGRAVSRRGRMRKCGPSGGGTLRRKSPQEGQRPSSPTGPATSARSQCPRASQSGLMHCTVKPGKYCIASPSEARSSRQSPAVVLGPSRLHILRKQQRLNTTTGLQTDRTLGGSPARRSPRLNAGHEHPWPRRATEGDAREQCA